MPLPANNPVETAEPSGGMKFAYAGGSRPLDGFTIKRGIGRGGFGEVYYAVSDAGKEVALKLVRRNLDVEVRGVTQCLNLKHTNLIALYDIKRDTQDDSWVVMEYVSGESLEDVLHRSPNGMTPHEVQHWLCGIFAAVAYLHDHGIVHRDLKPGNIFSDEGTVKIGDYGLSKFISCSRRSGQTESVGTVHYMAPEIANGRYGKEIDIYALGVIVYEMLTGHVPFEGESLGEVLMKHLTAEPDVSRLVEPYRSAVKKALAKAPAQRPASVEEFARLLQIPLQANSQTVPPVPFPSSPSRNSQAVPPPIPPMPGKTSPEVQVAQAMMHANIAAQYRHAQEEPIWRAIQDAWRQMGDAWRNSTLPTPLKVLILAPCIFLAVVTIEIWGPVLLVLGVVYGAYRLIRALFMGAQKSPSMYPPAVYPAGAYPPPIPGQPIPGQRPDFPPLPGRPAGMPTPPPPTFARSTAKSRSDRWRASAAMALATKPLRTKTQELTGSMLVAAIISAVGSMLVIAFRGVEPEAQQYAWLAMMSTLSAWAVLIPAKLWEAGEGEALLRRVTMFIVGMSVGGAAWLLYSAFQVSPNSVVLPWDHLESAHPVYWDKLYSTTGLPTRTAFVVYFALLLGVPAWWRLANPLRASRLSIWATAKPILWAWVLNFFWPCPYPWGVLVAVSSVVAIQVSSVWLSPETRHRPLSDVEGGGV